MLQKPVFVIGAGYHSLRPLVKSAPFVTQYCPLGYPTAPFAACTLILHPVLIREILARARNLVVFKNKAFLTRRLSGFEILNNATLIFQKWLVSRHFANVFHYLNFSEEYL